MCIATGRNFTLFTQGPFVLYVFIYTHTYTYAYMYITWYKLSEDDGNRKEEERKKKKIKKSRSIGGATRKDAWQRALRKSAVVDSLTD